MRRTMLTAAAVAALAITACGSDDDGGSGDGATATVAESDAEPGDADQDDAAPSGGGASAELVPLSSLGLDIPFELPWDIPVPADSSVALSNEAAGQQTVGLNSEATVEAITAEYDSWFAANFETVNADSALRSWQGIETTDTGSRALSAAISTCSDCPDYSTRVLISFFES